MLVGLKNRLLDEGWQKILQILPLKGKVNEGGTEIYDLFLVRTPMQLILKSASHDEWAFILDEKNFKYCPKMLEDELIFFLNETKCALKISIGNADKVRMSIALWRLQRRHGQYPSCLDVELDNENILVEELAAVETEVAICVVGHQPLLVWLECFKKSKEKFFFDGDVSAEVKTRFFLTPKKMGLVHFNEFGVLKEELLTGKLNMKSELGRTRMKCGDLTFLSGSQNGKTFYDVSKWIFKKGADRLVFSVGESLKRKEKRALSSLQKERLKTAVEQKSAIGCIALVALAQTYGEQEIANAFLFFHQVQDEEKSLEMHSDAKLSFESERQPNKNTLFFQMQIFSFTPAEKMVVLELGRDYWEKGLLAGISSADIANVFLELHRDLHQLLSATSSALEQGVLDLALAEHLLFCLKFNEAEMILERCLKKIPQQETIDLWVASSVLHPEGLLAFRVRALELLEKAREPEKADVKIRREIVQLCPVSRGRLESLSAALSKRLPENDVLQERVALVLQLLCKEESSLQNHEEDFPIEVKEFSDEILDEVVRHPSSRNGHALEFIQVFLAEQKVPDSSALKAYCERLSMKNERHLYAKEALAKASFALGMPAVEGYISRGEKSVGIFAYEGNPSFVLLGGCHLDDDDSLRLSPAELLFEVGAEVAHLRFQHTRVTSKEVWEGAWNKGKASVDFVLGMLPVFKGLKPVDRLADLIALIQKSPLGRVVIGVGVTDGAIKKAGLKAQAELELEGNVGTTTNELLATHRIMQLTADRAGLLLCQNLAAAVRSVFLESAETAPELEIAKLIGLEECLKRNSLNDTLVLRITALIAFYLSEDWERACT